MYLFKFNLYSPFQSEDFDHWCSIIYHMILNSNASIITKAANTLLLVNFKNHWATTSLEKEAS